MSEWKDCEHIFSNGTEFEIFYGRCLKCTRFRNEKCRILQRIIQAMWDESKFPYKDLQDHVKYGGKRCRSFTTEKQERHKKPVPGQISMFESEKEACQFLNVRQCSVAGAWRDKGKCKGYNVIRIGNSADMRGAE